MKTTGSRKPRILIVDDEPFNIMLLKGLLTRMGCDAVGANNATTALKTLDRTYDLVLSDVMMPEMDGFEMVRQIRKNPETLDIPIIMVTTLSEKEDRLKAVEAGANDFITKPVDKLELSVRTRSLLDLKARQDDVKRFEAELHQMVETRTVQLRRALRNLKNASYETVNRLAGAAEFKDDDTASHIKRMSRFCALIAEKAGLSDHEVELILHASPMHDIGKIGIPDAVLLKPGQLVADEWRLMKRHPEFGAKILADADTDLLRASEQIALTHHEKWDGSGYPNGLSGEEIPLYGRICAVADVFDALTSRRPYKAPFSIEKSIEIMKAGSGSHFDPRLLDLLLNSMDRILEIKYRFQDRGD